MANSISKRLLAFTFLAVNISFLNVANAQSNLILNGDFSHSFADWYYGDSINGSLGLNLPVVESFDTTGQGASNAAKFEVGQTKSDGKYEGGVLYQPFTVANAGDYRLFANAASSNTAASNGAGGFFQLAVDKTVVDFWHSGKILDDQILRRTLEGSAYLAAGKHTLAIFIRRPAPDIPDVTPFQYIDNVSVSAVPEPASEAMLFTGIAALGLLTARRRSSSTKQTMSCHTA